MTATLQLLVFVAAVVALVVFGFYRDRREHADLRQGSLYFPEHKDNEAQNHRGAAMSRLT
jgi:hypothetical protein